jgi:hypothetical protein
MAENVEKKVTIRVGANYNGAAALRSATADLEKLRKQAELPVMGPLNRDQSMVESMLKQRLTAMERAGERLRAKERVEEILFGRGSGAAGAKAMDEHTAAIKRQGIEIQNNAKHVMTWEKAWKAYGAALMIARTAEVGLRAASFARDWSRANEAKDLEKQTELEQGWRETLTGIPVVGKIGEAMQGAPFFGSKVRSSRALLTMGGRALGMNNFADYFDDKGSYQRLREEVEATQKSTKATDAKTAAMEKLFAVTEKLRLAARDANQSYGLATRGAGLTGEMGAVVGTAHALTQYGDVLAAQKIAGGKVAPEQSEMIANMGLTLMRDFRRAVFADLGRDVPRALGSMGTMRGLDSGIEQSRLRAAGRGIEADVRGIRDDAEARKFGVTDPAVLAKIDEEAKQRESERMQQYHKELLGDRRDFASRMTEKNDSATSRRMRLEGRSLDADKYDLDSGLRRSAEEIRDRYKQLIDANPAEAATLKKRAEEEIAAAQQGYALDSADLLKRRGTPFLPGMPGGPTGETRLSTGALGQGDLNGAREQLKVQRDLTAAMRDMKQNLPKDIAKAIAEALAAIGFAGPPDPTTYKYP